MPQYTIDEEVAMLVDAGLLTERQAEAYVCRFVEQFEIATVAERMDISEPTVSEYASAAAEKIDAAGDTIDALEEMGGQPERCVECGDGLGGSWITRADGLAVCDDCAEVLEGDA